MAPDLCSSNFHNHGGGQQETEEQWLREQPDGLGARIRPSQDDDSKKRLLP